MADADARVALLFDLVRCRAAVEHHALAIGARGRVVPETVPLRGLLRIKVVLIVERVVGFQPSDAMFETFAAKA